MQNWKASETQQSPELVEKPDSLVASTVPTEYPTEEDTSGGIHSKEAPSTDVVSHESVPKSKDSEPTATDPPPDLGDRYQILEFLGGGGMGTVWKVHDKSLDETFAIKVIRPEFMADEKAVKRFEKEAKLACDLTHANIAAIFGPGQDAIGRPYIIMRYVEGESLAEILAREGKLNPDRAMNIFQQVWDALTHSHMKGVIHRDIKPSNIIISQTENGADLVQLVDFGIARSIYDELSKTQGLTRAVEVFGSPRYMSPEQLLGQEAGPESDFYSLGCVLYEMLTGAPPFTEENPVKLVMQQLNSEPDMSKLPDKLKIPINYCLMKNANQRKWAIEVFSTAPGYMASPLTTNYQNIAPLAISIVPVILIGIIFLLCPGQRNSALVYSAGIIIMAATSLCSISFLNWSHGEVSKTYIKAEFATYVGFFISLLLCLSCYLFEHSVPALLLVGIAVALKLMIGDKYGEAFHHILVKTGKWNKQRMAAFNLSKKLIRITEYTVGSLIFTISLIYVAFFVFALRDIPFSFTSQIILLPTMILLLAICPFCLIELAENWPQSIKDATCCITRSLKIGAQFSTAWIALFLPFILVLYQPGLELVFRQSYYDGFTLNKNWLQREALTYPHTFLGDRARLMALLIADDTADQKNIDWKRKICYQIINNNSYFRKTIKASAYLSLASTFSGHEQTDAISKALDLLEKKDDIEKNDYRTRFWSNTYETSPFSTEFYALTLSIKSGDNELSRRAQALLDRDGVQDHRQASKLRRLKKGFQKM